MNHFPFVVVLLGSTVAMLTFRGLFWHPADASRRGDPVVHVQPKPFEKPLEATAFASVVEPESKAGRSDRLLSSRAPFGERTPPKSTLTRRPKTELAPPPIVEIRADEPTQFGPDGCIFRKLAND